MGHPHRLRLPVLPLLFVVALAACKKDDVRSDGQHGAPPPKATTSAASSGTTSSACEPANVGITDAKLAAILPATSGTWCVQRSSAPESWGEGTSKKIEDISDKIDGGGDIYVHSFYAKRFDVVKYVDSASKGEVELTLSTYDRPENAYGHFTYRVVSGVDPDPSAKKDGRPAKPVKAGGAAALQTGAALMWKGNYLVELAYTDETKDLASLTAAADAVLPEIARAIGEKLPGGLDLPADVRALPTEAEGRIPLGVLYVPPKYAAPNGQTDALHVSVAGGYAVGYLHEGEKRSRVYAFVRDDVDAAADAFAAFSKMAGATPLKEAKETADDAVYFPFSVAGGGAGAEGKAEGVAMRKGKLVLAIVDEELALGDASEKEHWPRLSKDEKVGKLRALLLARAAGIPGASVAPPAPSPSIAGSAPVPKPVGSK